jgi:hypothetical protein
MLHLFIYSHRCLKICFRYLAPSIPKLFNGSRLGPMASPVRQAASKVVSSGSHIGDLRARIFQAHNPTLARTVPRNYHPTVWCSTVDWDVHLTFDTQQGWLGLRDINWGIQWCGCHETDLACHRTIYIPSGNQTWRWKIMKHPRFQLWRNYNVKGLQDDFPIWSQAYRWFPL